MRTKTAFFFLTISLAGCVPPPMIPVGDKPKRVQEVASLQEPKEEIRRREETPLVAAVPGLNFPTSPVGSKQFGDLIPILRQNEIPSYIVTYDERVYPVSGEAGFYPVQNSIAVTRVLPILVSGIQKENEIRAAQGLSPLRELVLVGFSQGSVLILEILIQLYEFKKDWNDFLKAAEEEWPFLEQDPEFKRLRASIGNFLALKNAQAHQEDIFKTDLDLYRLEKKLSGEMESEFDHFKQYLREPEKTYPEATLLKKHKEGYPRRYPKLVEWFETKATQPGDGPFTMFQFFKSYVENEALLPLRIRIFSIAGSFFGSSSVGMMQPFMSLLPNRLFSTFFGPIKEQLKDNRLGAKDHFKMVKQTMEMSHQSDFSANLDDTFFVVGVWNKHSDGVVEHSSAHLSRHQMTVIPFSKLFEPPGPSPLKFQSRQMPDFPVTGIHEPHSPLMRLSLIKKGGISQITPENKTKQLLIPFVKKDKKILEKRRRKLSRPLTQSMVILSLPASEKLKADQFELHSRDKDLTVTTKTVNEAFNTVIWKGIFEKVYPLGWTRGAHFGTPAKCELTFSREGKPNVQIKIELIQGANHFIQVTEPAETKKNP